MFRAIKLCPEKVRHPGTANRRIAQAVPLAESRVAHEWRNQAVMSCAYTGVRSICKLQLQLFVYQPELLA
jgi:hypothetical protein